MGRLIVLLGLLRAISCFADEALTLPLALGISHTEYLGFNVAVIKNDTPSVVSVAVIREKGKAKVLRFIPKAPGNAMVMTTDAKGKRSRIFLIAVSAEPDDKLLLEEFDADRSRGIRTEILQLLPNLSHTIEVPHELGALYQTDDHVFQYLRVQDEAGQRKLILIPGRGSNTDFEIHSKEGKATTRYFVTVRKDAPEALVAERQATERARGLQVEKISLAVGESKTLRPGKQIGPAHLTAELIRYQREPSPPKTTAITITGRKAGLTDFTLHDMKGKPFAKYYVEVKGEAAGERAPAAECPAVRKGKRVEYYDLIAGRVCPQFSGNGL